MNKRDAIDASYVKHKHEFAGVPDITPIELATLRIQETVVIVDVRKPEEQAVSMLPGAITQEQFEQESKKHEWSTVVTYCTVGVRSGRYAKTLMEKGYKVQNLAGSILAWVHAGLPVEDADGNETKRVHVYGKDWALLPEGYETVY